ncbi:nucleotidyltransferase-like protein [Priestia koreensis]|uniref:nucleotidyltransferase-like protein n=1 Tax=Priestia koreensis TaxID=284581 RepID=UPI0028F6F65C|nr:nucleotidyltransferase-like protein [Priestia koreensis]
MEDILRPIYQERASNEDTLSILLIERRKEESPITENLDAVLFIIVREANDPLFIKHYEYINQKASLYVATAEQVNEWLLYGTNRRIVDWVLNGKVIFDRNEYIDQLRQHLLEFPQQERVEKTAIEFAKLIRRYIEGKDFYESKHYLDAFNHIIHALHHLARLSVIENGFHPEVTVWSQVRKIEPEIYKLYEELVYSTEELPKRLELLFLASEFLVNQRTEVGSKHFLEVLSEKEESWTFDEILNHPKLRPYVIDVGVLLEFLVGKGVVQVEKIPTKGKNIYHRHYKIEKN